MVGKFAPFDYEKARAEFSLDVPDDFNFAFDVVAKRAYKNDKTALIAIDTTGKNIVHHSYSDLDRASSRFANAMVKLGIGKGDTVVESAAVSKPDDLRGEIVLAYIVLGKGHEPSDALAKDIQDFVKKQTAPYKYPREIVFKKELPKTISGKIRRIELREEAGKR